MPSTRSVSGYKGRVYADFFLSLGASLQWAISNRELITINFRLTSFLESSLLVEQCVADSISDGSESEEVAD